MSDDEETTVRRRLSRLFEPVGAAMPAEGSRRGPDLDPDPPWAAQASSSADPRPLAAVAGPVPVRASGRAPESGRVTSAPDAAQRWPLTRLADEALPADDEGGRHGHDPVGAADDAGERRPLASRLPGPGAFDPGRRGVRALAAVAVVVVLVAGVWAWRSRPQAEPVRPAAAVDAPETSAPTASAGQVVVALAGKVRRPGLVRLPAGARVADAIEAAGGALPGVDVALLNPARKVTDGELILVGVTAPPGQAAPPGPVTGGGGPAAGGAAPGGGPVNLNTATLAQLDALPGVGPVLAQRILDHREQHGGFRSVSDLRQVDGIGDARYDQLKDLVTV
ncbi:helix-hairpin-helix domain-containing protein [Micromonospora sp. AP08]|uniref:helix-hairpin-helix domain-containing protein n=1 Tax=Micromonospora sp. AP08 TaxID=2604467 RepID=UPI003519F9ED